MHQKCHQFPSLCINGYLILNYFLLLSYYKSLETGFFQSQLLRIMSAYSPFESVKTRVNSHLKLFARNRKINPAKTWMCSKLSLLWRTLWQVACSFCGRVKVFWTTYKAPLGDMLLFLNHLFKTDQHSVQCAKSLILDTGLCSVLPWGT